MNWSQQRSTQGEVTALLWCFLSSVARIKCWQFTFLQPTVVIGTISALNVCELTSCQAVEPLTPAVWDGISTSVRVKPLEISPDIIHLLFAAKPKKSWDKMDILGHFLQDLNNESGYFWGNLKNIPSQIHGDQNQIFRSRCREVSSRVCGDRTGCF